MAALTPSGRPVPLWSAALSGRARIRRFAPPAVVAASTAIIAGVVATVDPEQAGHYPICPFLFLTGYYCPACGSLRAVHALLRGDVGHAVDRNPLLVAAVPFVLAGYLAWVGRLIAGRPPGRGRAPRWMSRALSWGLPAVLIVFGVLRNVPALSWLAP